MTDDLRTKIIKARRKSRLLDSQQPGFDLHEYIKKNRHREGLPFLDVTERQLDILMRYVPGPLGLGMSGLSIIEDMGISESTFYRILKRLKIKFPKAMEKIYSMRRAMVRQGGCFGRRMRSLNGMLAAVKDEGLHNELVDRI